MCGGLKQLLSMSVIDLGAGKIADLSSNTMYGSLNALLCFPCCSRSQSLSHPSIERYTSTAKAQLHDACKIVCGNIMGVDSYHVANG